MPKQTPHERSIKILDKRIAQIDSQVERLMFERGTVEKLKEQLRKEANTKP